MDFLGMDLCDVNLSFSKVLVYRFVNIMSKIDAREESDKI